MSFMSHLIIAASLFFGSPNSPEGGEEVKKEIDKSIEAAAIGAINHVISNPAAGSIENYNKMKSLPNSESDFNFTEELDQINRSDVKDKDKALARRFNEHFHGHERDGLCSLHAFNTCLVFSDKEPLKNVIRVSDDEFQGFQQQWLSKCIYPKMFIEENTIIGKEGETLISMKNRVEEKMKQVTTSGESVLLSVDEGAHWFTGYNDGEKIWFIDAQTQMGFNLYTTIEHPPEMLLEDEAAITIIHLTDSDFENYKKSVTWL